MWNLIWPVFVVVAANTIYNVSSKYINADVNVFTSLIVTYGVALIASIILCFATGGSQHFTTDLHQINWASVTLALGVVGIEIGFIYLYRNGWPVATGHITTSAILAVVLLIVGLLFLKESITPKQVLGIIVCIGGVALISMK